MDHLLNYQATWFTMVMKLAKDKIKMVGKLPIEKEKIIIKQAKDEG